MFKLSPRRNLRSKGFKVKHALQICLLLGVSIWLLYQVRHSHDKKASFGEGKKTGNEILKLGRRDLRPQVEPKAAWHIEAEDEAETKNEEQNRAEESDNVGKVGGNDETDVHDKDNGNDETDVHDKDKVEEEAEHKWDSVDGEKEKEGNEVKERDDKEFEESQEKETEESNEKEIEV